MVQYNENHFEQMRGEIMSADPGNCRSMNSKELSALVVAPENAR